jgi:hypothetical protein
VAYLNGSKVLTTGSALTFDGTNLGVGTSSPSSFLSNWNGIAVGTTSGSNGIAIVSGTASPGTLAFADGTSGSDQYRGYVQYAHSTDSLVFAAAATEGMRLTSTGLGIGTSSPGARLEVNGGAARVVNTNGRVYIENGNTSGGAKIGVRGTSDTTDGYLAFETYSREFGRFDSSGNLGLGVTPSAWYTSFGTKAFQFAASGALFGLDTSSGDRRVGMLNNAFINSGGAYTYINTGAATQYQQTVGQHQWFTAASGTAGDTISFTQAMTLDASGNLGVGTTSPSNRLHVAGSSTTQVQVQMSGQADMRIISDTGYGALSLESAMPLIFRTSATERARITSDGELMVGTTTSVSNGVLSVTKTGEIDLAGFWNQSSAGNGTALFVKRTNTGNLLYFVHSTSNTYVGQISTNGTTVSYTSASDARLKKNIVEATEAGSEIDALKVRAFDWKADNSHVKYGFIAQELIEVVPEAVSKSENPDGMMGVDYSKLVPMLVKEIQSLRTRLAAAGL